MNVYADPKLLDVRASFVSVPELDTDRNDREMKATGTGPNCAAPRSDFASILESTRANSNDSTNSAKKSKNPPKQDIPAGFEEWAVLDLNQRLPRCQRDGEDSENTEIKGPADDTEKCRTNCRTKTPDLEQVASELRGCLTADQCRRLAELLKVDKDR